MAVYPCDRHQGRYPGPQRTLYTSVYGSDGSIKRKYRVCKPCLDALLPLIRERTDDLYEPYPYAILRCLVCAEEEPAVYLVVTVYDEDDPEKRAGGVCLQCSGHLPQALGMPPGAGQDRL